MKELKEAYGIHSYREDGSHETFQPLEECAVKTDAGIFTPVYKVEDHGRKKLSPVKFHKNGTVKSISLQRAQTVRSSVGNIEAELVTFYPDGSLHRLFPLNGKLSGYWSETNEYKLAETLTIPTCWGIIAVKPINMQFYKTGLLKSITFWPGERVTIETPEGEMLIRKGISFYRDGSLHSCEPAGPVKVHTSIGSIIAYDSQPNGLDGSRNSLVFSESGEVLQLATVKNEISVIDDWGFRFSFSPGTKSSLCDEGAFTLIPLRITFDENMVLFRKGSKTFGKVHQRSRFLVSAFTENGKAENICT